ncbi:YdcF family protein [Propionivibrio soli]|uniref:YdcF family protein n=1 Tax=Propionivibrio soli TaxID=2976531 RepID=UPI0021E9AD4D|nr:YdcF family protein [Propionivibrio soli]
MNKKNGLIALALSALLAFAPNLSFARSESDVAAPSHSVQVQADTADYGRLISRRQIVDQLLADALQSLKAPARISTAGFTAKMPSNMELVTDRLLEAYQLEPYRTDLLISAANAQIYNGNVERAISLFEKALSVAPDDVDVNSYLAVWQRFKQNEAATAYLKRVSELNAGRAADLQRIFDTVDRIVRTPLTTQAGPTEKGRRAIVALGYALNPDGSMHEILVGRLETTLALAKADPDALIIVTGGVPQNRKTEGKLMADWLVQHGIGRDRVIEENYATSTVDNALFSAYALARHRIDSATLVSSASHVRRGQALLEIACWQSGPANIRIQSVSYPDKPLPELAKASAGELLGIYRDALRTYGLWSYRSAPLLER